MTKLLLIALCAVTAVAQERPRWFVQSARAADVHSTDPSLPKGILADLSRAEQLLDSVGVIPPDSSAGRVVVIAMPTHSDFKKYQPGRDAGAYFVVNGQFQGILLGPDVQHNRRVLMHEYIHYRVERAGWRLPSWLNEGIAEHYSTLHLDHDGKVAAGEQPASSSFQARKGWIPFSTIVAAGGHGVLTEAEQGSAMYAQCRFAAQMLVNGDRWRGHFSELIAAFNAGMTTEVALLRVYGVTVDQFDAELQSYVKDPNWHCTRYDAVHSDDSPVSGIQKSDPFDVRYALAEVILDANRRIPALKQVAEEFPDRPGPYLALAAEMLRGSNSDAAKSYLRMALDCGSTDAKAVADYAQLIFRSEGPVTQEEIEWVLHKDPLRDDVRLRKALWLYEQDEPEKALATLNLIRVPPAGQEALYYQAVVVSACAVGQYDQAKSAFEKVRKATKAPSGERRADICSDSSEE